MITNKTKIDKYYKIIFDKIPEYTGIFFVGVKTTGIFCNSICSAKKPYKENCEFFENAEEALLASYRPCKRCKPLSLSTQINQLIEMVELNPERKWKDKDFNDILINPNTSRRQFKEAFDMTFVQYARARRMGIAFKHIRNGESIITTKNEDEFHDAFSKIMGVVSSKTKNIKLLYSAWIETTLGSMLVICDEQSLYLLEFVDRRGLENEILFLRKRLNAVILPKSNEIIKKVEDELTKYFNGKLINFTIPIQMIGSDFQKSVWNKLIEIPCGNTKTYTDIAKELKNPTAIRAVGNANGKNIISIIIPCHRIIKIDGSLGGYGGGLERKKWLLQHEVLITKDQS